MVVSRSSTYEGTWPARYPQTRNRVVRGYEPRTVLEAVDIVDVLDGWA